MLMPRSGPSYPIDDHWRSRVQRALDERGWSRADLAREIRASRSVVTNILNGVVNQSPYVADIHLVLRWSAPTAPSDAPLLAEEEQEVIDILRKLSDKGKARFAERGHALLEQELELAHRNANRHADEDPSPPDHRSDHKSGSTTKR